MEGPGDARIVSVEGLNELASGAATTQRALRAKAVELKLSIDAHARRIAELDQAIADAILRIRLLSEPDVFFKEQG